MEALFKAIEEIVEKLDYYLYNISFAPRDGDMVLSVEIDHPDGINIDDCVKVSEVVSDFLDETDPIESSYGLEVTSAGAERELRTEAEINRAHGKYVHVKTFDQVYEGTLEKIEPGSITIRDNNKQKTSILLADVELIRLAIEL